MWPATSTRWARFSSSSSAARGPHRLESYSTAEVYRAICETEPRAPSASATDPHSQRELRGDLDTLVLHAMAKDPAARYPRPTPSAPKSNAFWMDAR